MVFVFIFHFLAISISRSLYLLSFSNCLAGLFLSDDTLISISWHALFFLCLITISELLSCIVLSVLIGNSWNMVTLGVSTTGNVSYSYHLSGLSISSLLLIFQCPTRLCLIWGKNMHPEMSWSVVLLLVLQNLHVGSAPLWRILPEMSWSVVLLLVLQNRHVEFAPLWRILAWKFLVKMLWSCAAAINPSVSVCLKASTSQSLMGFMYIYISFFDFEVGIGRVTVLLPGSIDSILSLFP